MPDLTGPYTVADGAVVELIVGIGRAHFQALRNNHQPIPQPVVLRALLDPGAEATCLDRGALHGLLPFGGLQPANLPALGGLTFAHQTSASLTISTPAGPGHPLVVPDCPVLELDLSGAGCEALIGRDLLSAHLLVLDGPAGSFVLRY